MSATATETLTPAQIAFTAALNEARNITHAEMCEAVALLPDDIRARLAIGPHRHRWTCSVCDAFGASFYRGTIDLTDARWIVWIYHEVPKSDMRHRDQLHYGERANEIYRRCIATYRAAGWAGEAAEPNA